ncbi:hypothetical protein MMPV_000831 [Pyropia vietnamensis]
MDLYGVDHDVQPSRPAHPRGGGVSPPPLSASSALLLSVARRLASVSLPADATAADVAAGLVGDDPELTALMARLTDEEPPTVRADTAAVAALPTVYAEPVGRPGREEMPSCPVCAEELEELEPVRRLPCGHLYHGDCILPWLARAHTCPACRFELKKDGTAVAELRRSAAREEASRELARGMYN